MGRLTSVVCPTKLPDIMAFTKIEREREGEGERRKIKEGKERKENKYRRNVCDEIASISQVKITQKVARRHGKPKQLDQKTFSFWNYFLERNLWTI